MSEVKVNKISPRTNCGTVQLGDSGDTITIPAGATISNLGTAAGFGSTGEVSWNTTVQTTSFTATSGSGFFVNTAGGAVTVTLPSSPSAGNVVAISDYNSTAATNNITIARNSSNINGGAQDIILSKANSAIQLVYVDATTGWQSVTSANTADVENPNLIATGGTITTCGDCKIHTFTGPGTFTVTNASLIPANNTVSYLVVAGGGGGSGSHGGGGGGGGFREYKNPVTPYIASPLDGNPCGTAITVTATAFPITVGGGGAGGQDPGTINGGQGSTSTFSTVSSAGGAGGANYSNSGLSGGSGGGGKSPAGTGNTPPVTPPQGSNGGTGPGIGPNYAVGGGGGATEVGQNACGNTCSGRGGAGATTSISGSPLAYSGGGGSGTYQGGTAGAGSPCGTGGAGGAAGGNNPGTAGTINRGGGSGGRSYQTTGGNGTAGGSGIVIIRYKYQ